MKLSPLRRTFRSWSRFLSWPQERMVVQFGVNDAESKVGLGIGTPTVAPMGEFSSRRGRPFILSGKSGVRSFLPARAGLKLFPLILVNSRLPQNAGHQSDSNVSFVR